MNKQKFKYRTVVFGNKKTSNCIDLVARETRTNWKKKWHEESSVNLQIKVTFGYFCGQEMLSYVVATKISHKFDPQNFSNYHLVKMLENDLAKPITHAADLKKMFPDIDVDNL